MGALGRLLVVVYTWRGENIRIISARPAETHEREEYEAESCGIDTTLARESGPACFRRSLSPRAKPESQSGQTKILWIAFFEWRKNLGVAPAIKRSSTRPWREYLDRKAPKFEDTLRRIIREEFEIKCGLAALPCRSSEAWIRAIRI